MEISLNKIGYRLGISKLSAKRSLIKREVNQCFGIELLGTKDLMNFNGYETLKLRELLDKKGLIIIPTHRILNNAEQLQLTNLLGSANKEISYITSNLNNAAIDKTTFKTYLYCPLWHNDFSYYKNPPHITVLQMVKSKTNSWETSFISLNKVHEQLSEDIKIKCKSLKVMYSKANGVHPLLWIHPFTGKPLVFFDFRFANDVSDLCTYSGKVVFKNMNQVILDLGDLFSTAAPVYKHDWQLGDIIIIDNYAISKKENFKNNIKDQVLLRRTTTKGVFF